MYKIFCQNLRLILSSFRSEMQGLSFFCQISRLILSLFEAVKAQVIFFYQNLCLILSIFSAVIAKAGALKTARKGAAIVEYGLILGATAAFIIPASAKLTGTFGDVFCGAEATVSSDAHRCDDPTVARPILSSPIRDVDATHPSQPDEPIDPVEPEKPFDKVMRLTVKGDKIKLVFDDADIVIDWGDGSQPEISKNSKNFKHDYDADGVYNITVKGTASYFSDKSGDIISVESFGDLGLVTLEDTFDKSDDLKYVGPLPSSVTSLKEAFEDFEHTVSGLESWDTSAVTNMSETFADSEYNGDISSWNTSSVITMDGMFKDAEKFDQPIGGWDTSRVVNMHSMFEDAEKFDQDLSRWDTSSVTSMKDMFKDAQSMSADLSSWCVENFDKSPKNFSEDSRIYAEPVWGTCPNS